MFVRRQRAPSVGALLLSIYLMGCSPEVSNESCLPGPAPECGQPCNWPCGCGDPVSEACLPGDRLAKAQGSCLLVQQVCRPAACIDSYNAPADARCAANCSDVKLAYAEAQQRAQVAGAVSGRPPLAPGPYNGSSSCEPADCVVTSGHCELGLDTCWYLGPPIEELDSLAEFYVELGCPADLACDCPAPPADVSCEASEAGFEIWGSSETFSHACVVH